MNGDGFLMCCDVAMTAQEVFQLMLTGFLWQEKHQTIRPQTTTWKQESAMKHSILGSLLSLAIKHTRAAFALSIMLLMMGFASSSRVILIPSTFHRAPTTIKNRSRKNKIEWWQHVSYQTWTLVTTFTLYLTKSKWEY